MFCYSHLACLRKDKFPLLKPDFPPYSHPPAHNASLGCSALGTLFSVSCSPFYPLKFRERIWVVSLLQSSFECLYLSSGVIHSHQDLHSYLNHPPSQSNQFHILASNKFFNMLLPSLLPPAQKTFPYSPIDIRWKSKCFGLALRVLRFDSRVHLCLANISILIPTLLLQSFFKSGAGMILPPPCPVYIHLWSTSLSNNLPELLLLPQALLLFTFDLYYCPFSSFATVQNPVFKASFLWSRSKAPLKNSLFVDGAASPPSCMDGAHCSITDNNSSTYTLMSSMGGKPQQKPQEQFCFFFNGFLSFSSGSIAISGGKSFIFWHGLNQKAFVMGR